MGNDILTTGEAWKVYDRWLDDTRIDIRHEPPELNLAFRAATRSISRQSSPKAIGDHYLRALSKVLDATLVTFDHGLASACRKARHSAILLE